MNQRPYVRTFAASVATFWAQAMGANHASRYIRTTTLGFGIALGLSLTVGMPISAGATLLVPDASYLADVFTGGGTFQSTPQSISDQRTFLPLDGTISEDANTGVDGAPSVNASAIGTPNYGTFGGEGAEAK